MCNKSLLVKMYKKMQKFNILHYFTKNAQKISGQNYKDSFNICLKTSNN